MCGSLFQWAVAVCLCLITTADTSFGQSTLAPTRMCHIPGPGDENWQAGYEPRLAATSVNAIAVSGTVAYVGGLFTRAGQEWVTSIAGWDGTSWFDLDGGVWGSVSELVAIDGDLYVSGGFVVACNPEIRNLARWSSSSGWSAVGTPQLVPTAAMATDGNDLYVAIAGSAQSTTEPVLRWDGSQWNPLGSFDAWIINAIEVDSQGRVYVGGNITAIDGQAVGDIAAWDGTSWSDMQGGVKGCSMAFGTASFIEDIVASGDRVYITGTFIGAGNATSTNAAYWDANGWHTVNVNSWCGGWVGQSVALHPAGGTLYWSDMFEDVTKQGYERTYGTHVRSGEGNRVTIANAVANVFTDFDGALLAGFGGVNGSMPGGDGNLGGEIIAAWDGSTWRPLGDGLGTSGNGFDSVTRDIFLTNEGTMYVGGHADRRYDQAAFPYSYYAGLFERGTSGWTNLRRETGRLATIESVILFGGSLYAAGSIWETGAGNSNQQHYVLRYEGGRGFPLGDGLDNIAHCMVTDGERLLVGGDFSAAGGVVVNHIASWDGETWQPLGDGVDGSVYALAYRDGKLYAGGDFLSASGTQARHVAVWNGVEWSALGDGVDGRVNALVPTGDALLVAGAFEAAGGASARRVALWRDGAWTALGEGFDAEVLGMELSAGGWLYACGRFTQADSSPADHVARWDGVSWGPMGAGVDGPVHDVATAGAHVYFAGNFRNAGPYRSQFFAEWVAPEPVPIRARSLGVVVESEKVTLSWELDWDLPVAQYRIVRFDNDASSGRVMASLSPGTSSYTDETVAPSTRYRYELQVIRADESEASLAFDPVQTQGLSYQLQQNRPNPFNPGTSISFTIAEHTDVKLLIYDVRGALVRLLVADARPAGHYNVRWDGRNNEGKSVASGIYFYLLESGAFRSTRKMVLLR